MRTPKILSHEHILLNNTEKKETRSQYKIQSIISSDSDSSFMNKAPLVDRTNSHI